MLYPVHRHVIADTIRTLAQNGSISQPMGSSMIHRNISVSLTTPSTANIDLNSTE